MTFYKCFYGYVLYDMVCVLVYEYVVSHEGIIKQNEPKYIFRYTYKNSLTSVIETNYCMSYLMFTVSLNSNFFLGTILSAKIKVVIRFM